MISQLHEEDWATYLTTVYENRLGSVLVDLGLIAIAPIQYFNKSFTFTTYFNQPNEDGLTSESEYEIINQIEDNLINLLTSNSNTIYSGRIKFDGKMQSYFYSEKLPEVENCLLELQNKFSDYSFEHTIKDEENWTSYFEILYPSEFEMQIIQNGKVIENLQKYGDLFEKERLVEHWIYFTDSNNREQFINEIKGTEFEIVEKAETSSDELPFLLRLSRVDKVDYESVNEYTMFLWQKAKEFNGEYDGWETFIVKD
jgi:uncharacterized protein (TIGR01619 family)